jgi:hypothetical protein
VNQTSFLKSKLFCFGWHALREQAPQLEVLQGVVQSIHDKKQAMLLCSVCTCIISAHLHTRQHGSTSQRTKLLLRVSFRFLMLFIVSNNSSTRSIAKAHGSSRNLLATTKFDKCIFCGVRQRQGAVLVVTIRKGRYRTYDAGSVWRTWLPRTAKLNALRIVQGQVL